MRRYLMIKCEWRGSRRCLFVKRTACHISRSDYVDRVMR